jgi:hypothetical protein
VKFLVKCCECEWEGKEEKLVEKPGCLQLNDYVAANSMMMDIARSNHQCPRCAAILKSHRLVDGMVQD